MLEFTLKKLFITTTFCAVARNVYNFSCIIRKTQKKQLFLTSYHFQDNFLTEKRTKPSLSIVNPLDILRQRLILEMARRQMRENTKQVNNNA